MVSATESAYRVITLKSATNKLCSIARNFSEMFKNGVSEETLGGRLKCNTPVVVEQLPSSGFVLAAGAVAGFFIQSSEIF